MFGKHQPLSHKNPHAGSAYPPHGTGYFSRSNADDHQRNKNLLFSEVSPSPQRETDTCARLTGAETGNKQFDTDKDNGTSAAD